MIYFDHAASTPLRIKCLHFLQTSLMDDFANPSAAHSLGRSLQDRIDNFRLYLLQSLNLYSSNTIAQSSSENKMVCNLRNQNYIDASATNTDFQVIFTSSATEANNLVTFSLPIDEIIISHSKTKIAFSSADHPSVVKPLQYLAAKFANKKTVNKINNTIETDTQTNPQNNNQEDDDILFDWPLSSDGLWRTDEHVVQKLKDLPTLSFLSICHVHSVGGQIQPLKDIVSIVREHSPKCHIHVDAVQSFGKLNFDMFNKNKKLDLIDSLVISAHKMGGPKGVSALVVRKTFHIKSLFYGGSQEEGIRPSTLNAPLILAWEKAIEESVYRNKIELESVNLLNVHLRQKLLALQEFIDIPFSYEITSNYIVLIYIKNFPSDIILRHLEQEQIYISTSTSCSSKAKNQNPTYARWGYFGEAQNHFLRLSLSYLNTEDEIDVFISKLSTILQKLKKITNFNNKSKTYKQI